MGPRKKLVPKNAPSPPKEDANRRSSSRLSLVPSSTASKSKQSDGQSPKKHRKLSTDAKELRTRKASRINKADLTSSNSSDNETDDDEDDKEPVSDENTDKSYASDNNSNSTHDSRIKRRQGSSRTSKIKAMPIRETRRRSCTLTTANDKNKVENDDEYEDEEKLLKKSTKNTNISSSSESNSSFESTDEVKLNDKRDLYDAEENSNLSAIHKANEHSHDEDDDDDDEDDDDESETTSGGEDEETAMKENLNEDGEATVAGSNKPMKLTKNGKIDRRTLRGQLGWGRKGKDGEEKKRKKRRRKSRKSLFVNQKYINRQKYILQMAAANGVDISNNPTNKSLLSNTLNNNINNSFSAQLTMLNQQAGCERAPKYVEINYMFKPVILNTFDKGYLIFNYNKEKLEIGSSNDQNDNNNNNKATTSSANSNTLEQINKNQQKVLSTLPKVNLEVLKEFPMCYSEFALPLNLIKFNEKSPEELDDEVEYDMDDEDNVWLNMINEERKEKSTKENSIISEINQEQFEMIMDRLEKESYFQQTTSSTKPTNDSNNEAFTKNGSNRTTPNTSPSKLNQSNNDSLSNDDALCCICLDGECLNSNAILFCDMCNLAVHQECYGVPYIPEGQWLCRRCICSPSNPVSCELCPNKHGAFKQTDRGAWAHVICAIWIPEVHFANTVFLEPIIGLENIDKARWKLTCYICRKKNAGACIQCAKANCYTAFHVTCAQQAGLVMNLKEESTSNHRDEDEELHEEKVDGRKKKGPGRRSNIEKKNAHENEETEVKRLAFCDIHTPLDIINKSPSNKKNLEELMKSGIDPKTDREEAMKQLQKIRMRRARKILAERSNLPPTICLPVIPQERIDEIKNKLDESVEDKNEFFDKLVKYWLMKRYSRNGVPLLRRLQTSSTLKKNSSSHKSPHSNPNHSKTSTSSNDVTDLQKFRENLSNFKRLRQDLERARILMEQIRKRERLKLDQIKIFQVECYYEINGFNGVFLKRLLNIFCELDKNRFFLNPVDAKEAPTYYEEIKEPMDFKKIQAKINALDYKNFLQFENDFNLIIKNCCQFNQKNSIYYKAAVKMKEQSASILKQARSIYENTTFPDVSEAE